MGSWLLSFGGRQAELSLRRGGPGLRGELTVRQGQRAVRNEVEGEYSAETRTLRLRDREAVPDAGRYELQLSPDGLRIEGRFVREDTGDITRLRGWRPE